MGVLHPLLGFRSFIPVNIIRERMRLMTVLQIPDEKFIGEHMLLLSTVRQRTWLLASTHRLFYVLDDAAKDDFYIWWEKEKHTVVRNREIAISLRVIEDHSPRSAKVAVGDTSGHWLYSKKNYPSKDVFLSALSDFIFLKCNW